MRIKKEAIIGNKEAIQDLIDSLAEEVSYGPKYPGDIKLNGSIEDLIRDFLHTCFSIDYPTINNGLKLFNRVTTARRILDNLPSLSVVWLVNNINIEKTSSWVDRIDANFKKPKQFADNLPVTLRIDSFNYTIIEYNGSLRVGGTWRKEKEAFGTSLTIEMKQKFADANDYYVKLDPHTNDRFQDLDLDSRKLEYTKIQHTPFKSLFCFGKDLPLFRKNATSIKPSDLASLALVVYNGTVEGNLSGLKGDKKKTELFFSDNKYYTNIEIEGLQVWNGKTGESKEQARLLRTLIDEVSALHKADAFNSVACDIQVFVLDQDDNVIYKQLATLAIREIKNDFCGTISEEKSLVQVSKPASLDLERLERDNTIIKNIQSKFDDFINRSSSITYTPDTEDFDISVLSFLKELKDYILPEELQKDFIMRCYLDKEKEDLFDLQSLDQLKVWKEFKADTQWYDYKSLTTEEFVFDIDLDVFMKTMRKEEKILTYSGSFSIELESKIKTNLSVNMKAKKLNTSIDKEYIPKKAIDRFSDLELD